MVVKASVSLAIDITFYFCYFSNLALNQEVKANFVSLEKRLWVFFTGIAIFPSYMRCLVNIQLLKGLAIPNLLLYLNAILH